MLKDMVIRIVDANAQHGCLQYLSEASMVVQARHRQRMVCSSREGMLESSRLMKNLIVDSRIQEGVQGCPHNYSKIASQRRRDHL